MKILFSVMMALLLTGCATANIEHLFSSDNVHGVLQGNETVFIALPQDGVFEGHTYVSSGRYVQEYFYDNVLRYADNVINATQPLSLAEAQEEAKTQKADVLIYPRIVHWEDRNTPWSGLRDKVRINVQVYSLAGNKVLDKTSLYATNRWLTFVNAAPQNRLKTIIDPYVQSLYK